MINKKCGFSILASCAALMQMVQVAQAADAVSIAVVNA